MTGRDEEGALFVIVFGDGAELEFGQRTCVAGTYDGNLTSGCGGGCGGWLGGWCYGCHICMNVIGLSVNDFSHFYSFISWSLAWCLVVVAFQIFEFA